MTLKFRDKKRRSHSYKVLKKTLVNYKKFPPTNPAKLLHSLRQLLNFPKILQGICKTQSFARTLY